MTATDAAVQRAFELANSGGFASVSDLRAQLAREGHFFSNAHLEGPALRKQLRSLIRLASGGGS
ncbi:hypothetical protein [Novosphingobium sp. P6W]|uniref:hypothetical protein n=1 Tax=Novosphingobium sp. P6W TaxID=1609758 RepID=UPI0013B46371|nr:hypothetical protein [Novosphingobium sp. P6W]